MAEGKWIKGLTPDLSVAEAARLALAERFAVVLRYVPLAVEKPFEDVEYVHQLRVGTRRATAALRVFAPCLPRKTHKAARRCLRSVRRAAGEARDWDVFLLGLPAWPPLATAPARPAKDFLTGYALGERAAAQRRLAEAVAADGPELTRWAAELPHRVRAPEAGTADHFGSFAACQFGNLLAAFTEAVRADPADPPGLHQLRILGKRTRYALELFAPCFPPVFSEVVYPALEQLQELLGAIQDAYVGIGRLTELRGRVRAVTREWPRLRPGFEALLRYLRSRLTTGRRAFPKWRKDWLDLIDGLKLEVATTTVSAPG